MPTRPREYSGNSDRGNFNEALAGAIAEARAERNSNYFAWTVSAIGGDSGGVVGQTRLQVTIVANQAEEQSLKARIVPHNIGDKFRIRPGTPAVSRDAHEDT